MSRFARAFKVRLALTLAPTTCPYSLADFLPTLALPKAIESWSLTMPREKLVKIGASIVRHGRNVIFQLSAAVPRALFPGIQRRIEPLRIRPPPPSA